VTAGIDAIGEVTIRLKHKERIYSGHAANTDIIVASAQAYVNALNRLYGSLQRNESSQKPTLAQELTAPDASTVGSAKI
ncbi:MAG: alpha-isopropylmalate synthase regulatory domain-containing protein, partial [Crinalium sp.]